MVIDFTASWCGPCQLIQPAVDEFAQKYSDVEFIKIDVDELHVCHVLIIVYVIINYQSQSVLMIYVGYVQGVAEEFNVQAMPTFMLMKEGKQVDKIVGAKKDDLRKKIEKHRPVLKMDQQY